MKHVIKKYNDEDFYRVGYYEANNVWVNYATFKSKNQALNMVAWLNGTIWKESLLNDPIIEFFPMIIRSWAKERGIYQSGDVKTQTCKLLEEAGEIGRAICKNDKALLKDSIGDAAVVLVNLARLAALKYDDPTMDFEFCIEAAWNEIKDRTGEMKNGTFKKDN